MLQQASRLLKCATRNQLYVVVRHLSVSQKNKNRYRNHGGGDGGAAKWLMLVFPVAGFGLGTWQVKRKKWKLGLIQLLEERTNRESIPFPDDLRLLQDLEYVPLKVTGTYDHSREIQIGPRSLVQKSGENSVDAGSLMSQKNQNIGYHVITPFRIKDSNLTIHVNRGFVPFSKLNPQTRLEGQIKGQVEVIGILRHNEKRPPLSPRNSPEAGQWFYKDLDDMTRLTGASPILLDAVADPSLPAAAPVGGQTRVTLRDEHLSYIVTWYGLAVATAIMWYYRFIKK